MKNSDSWWTFPAEGDGGKTVIVTGRDNIDDFRESGKYIYRIDVSCNYEGNASGMPSDEDARMMEQITDNLLKELKKDKVAVMTGIYTGEGRRDWIFYCKNLSIFNKIFNRALQDLPTIPFVIEAQEDKDWEEYTEMRDKTYVADED